MKVIKEIYNQELANVTGYNLHTFTCNSASSRLHLVKAIKILTNLGLYESKTMTDSIPFRVQFFSNFEKIRSFEEMIQGNVEYELSTLSHIRHNKLIELGVGEKSDFTDYLADKIYVQSFKENFKDYLITLLECLDEDKLKEMINI